MMSRKPTLLFVIGLALGGALVAIAKSPGAWRPLNAEAIFDHSPEEKRLIGLFERVAPSVVFIRNDELRQDFFSLNVLRVSEDTGSGFVWDSQGHVVTNYHVIEKAHSRRNVRLSVVLPDQSSWPAAIVGVAMDKDLALLKIDAPSAKFSPITLGSSDDLRVGMTALAIGNPFGLDNSLTRGIISALGREITSRTQRTITDVIQTDAAINPGNSGGPLLNSRGELIGVNTAILSSSGSSSGIGFAVPVNTVRRVIEQLVKHGRVIRPGFGINILRDDVSRNWARRHWPQLKHGVMVLKVFPGSSAERAGIQGMRFFRDGSASLGDIITKIDKYETRNRDDLLNALDRFQVGDVVELTFLRETKESTVRVRLQTVE